jgi:hypothetical protein
MIKQRKINIGSSRIIEIYSDSESKKITNDSAEEVYDYSQVSELFPDNSLQIIGMINLGFPIIKGEGNSEIYAITSSKIENPPIFIANNSESLNHILDMIENAWKNKIETDWLTKTDENKQIKSDILSKISQIDTQIDLSFWDWIAFKELSISLS